MLRNVFYFRTYINLSKEIRLISHHRQPLCTLHSQSRLHWTSFEAFPNKYSSFPHASVTTRFLHISSRCLDDLTKKDNHPKTDPSAAATFADKTLSEKDKKECASVPPIKSTISVSKKPASDMATISSTGKNVAAEVVKKSLWERFVAEMKHYWHGTKFLYFDIKVAVRLTWKMRSDTLSRRERKQLIRTVADMFRLVPFLFFIVIPGMEFLLPIYLKFMPFMLPSTFQEEKSEKEKLKRRFKAKLEMAKFLQETLVETNPQPDAEKVVGSVAEFNAFMAKIRESGEIANVDEIVKFSSLFEDELTLENLDEGQLKALSRLLELTPIGNSTMLRWRLQLRMRDLEVDDQIIRKEGVKNLAVYELQQACRDRGMRALGMPKDRLVTQLNQWLELHLDRKVPISLMLMTRVIYQPDELSAEDQLKEVMKTLPEATVAEVVLKTGEKLHERVDNKAKLARLKKEEEMLKKEDQEEIAAAAADKLKKEELLKKEEVVAAEAETKAAPAVEAELQDAAPAVQKDIAEEIEEEKDTEISGTELAEGIEAAMDNIGTELDEEELDELKEEMSQQAAFMYEIAADAAAEQQQQTEAVDLMPPEVEDHPPTKAAVRLNEKLSKMVEEMDSMMDKLNSERADLRKDIALQEVKAQHAGQGEEELVQKLEKQIRDRKDRMIGINDVQLALRKIQKLPDDVKWERILQVLDEDQDGKLELDHLRRVVELLGTENVKLGSKELQRVMDILEKEEAIAKPDDADSGVDLSSSSDSDSDADKPKPKPKN